MKLYLIPKTSQVLYLLQDEGYLIIERQTRGVHLYGIVRPPQRRVISAPVGLISLFDAPGLLLDFVEGRLTSGILEQSTPGAFIEPGDEKNLHVRIGEHDGTHVSPVGY